MPYVYRHFISQNIAPKGVKRIGVYDSDGKRVCTVPLGGLTPPSKEKLYSFGIVSDTHMGYNSYTNTNEPTTVGLKLDDGNGYGTLPNGTLLRRALTFMSEQGVDFCCNAGDLTNIGFYFARGDTEVYPYQFQEYRDICALFPHMPMYNIMGNHESYNADITETLDELEEYTGNREIAYYFEKGNDVFVFVGQSKGSVPMTDEHLQWLQEKLVEFNGKRCFVFVHSYLYGDSGNPCNARDNSIFGYWQTYFPEKLESFMNALSNSKNVVLFHGHSHMKFESQELDKNANYTQKNGFKSVHIPSCGDPRTLLSSDGTWETEKNGSQGYIVDVYDDCIVLNGWDFAKGQCVPVGVIKVNT